MAFFFTALFVAVPCAFAQGRTADSAVRKTADTTSPKIIGLKTVEVTVTKPPFSIRNDTLEFDATAIKLAANASVLQLLKKLPGIVIGSDGSITVNGKSITKIKVDGREFFGDNKEAATKYLPAEIIDKVEVTTAKEVATMRSLSIKAPSQDATINLVLKKDKRTGILGNITAGAGSFHRYLTDGMVSAMRDPVRISVMGAAKNATDNLGGTAMAVGAGGGGQGEGGAPEERNGNISINTKSGEKLTIDINYQYNNIKNTKTEYINRLNLLPDNSFRNERTSEAMNRNDQHQLYTSITYEKDSLTIWTFRPRAGLGKNIRTLQTYGKSTSVTGELLNTLVLQNKSEERIRNAGNEINFNKTSRNHKLNLNTTWNFDINNKEEQEHNNTGNNFYENNIVSKRDSTNQYIHSANNSFNNNFTFNLSAALGHGFVIALDYGFNSTYNHQRRGVFNYNQLSGKYGEIDSTLSSSNKSSGITHTPSIQLAWKNDRLSVALNTGMRIMQQQNRLLWMDSVISVHQQQFAPNLQLNYSVSKYGQLFTNYAISSSAPSAEQLSPVADNTNPLFMKVGNPSLKGTFTQNISATYYYYQPVRGFSLNISGNGSMGRNEIVTDQYYDSLGRQTSTYRNVNGTWRMMIHAGINLQKKKNDWTFNHGFSIGMDNNRSIGFVAQQKNIADEWNIRPGFYFSMTYKEWVSISPSVSVNISKTAYSLPGIEKVSYNTQRLNLQWQLTPVKRLELSGDMVYNYNSQVTVQRSYYVCNSAIAYSFGRKEQMKLKCRVNDIFNNNTSISNVTTATYMETKEVNALQRYVLLSIQFFLGKMGRPSPQLLM
jgi:hypothetical protein